MNSQGSSSSNLTQFNCSIIYNSYKDVLEILNEETVLIRKLECIQILVTKFLPSLPLYNLESEILHCLMPAIKEALILIFEKTIELADENSEQICQQTLTALREHLQLALGIIQKLDDILEFIIQKNSIDLSCIQSVPLHLGQVLYSVFLHCKESNNFYKIYFDYLNEVLLLFKKAQELHGKFLRVLDAHVTFNFLFDDELLLLIDVLGNLADIGEILAGLNLKSMADNWKGYTVLTQKHANVLQKDFNIERPLTFLTMEIIKNQRNITEMDLGDLKTLTQTLKIINFLIKVMLKLCETFWLNIKSYYKIIWNFFISLYSFSREYFHYKLWSENVIEQIELYIFDGLDQFQKKLCFEEGFFKISNFDCIENCNVFGFILISNIFLKMLCINGECKTILNKIDIASYMEMLFLSITKCFKEFIISNVHENIVTTFSAVIVQLNDQQFSKTEGILYKNLLDDNIWNSLIASDIWSLIISISPADYGYDVLCIIVNQCQEILKSNFTYREKFVSIQNFIRLLYQMQNNDYKLKFIIKYPVETHPHIWKHIGFKYLPNNFVSKIDSLVLNVLEKMEKFDGGYCTFDNFIYMCDVIQAVSTIPFEEIYLDINRLSQLMLKLWDFNASDCILLDNYVFKLFLQNLCKLTKSLTWKLNNTQLNQVLEQLKVLVAYNNTCIKLSTLTVLSALSKKFIENTNEQCTIFSNISELFNTLLKDENFIIKQNTLEVFTNFINDTTHEEIAHYAVKNVEDMVSNFVGKNVIGDLTLSEQYLGSLVQNSFQHKCLNCLNSLHKDKRSKIEDSESTFILERMKKDVNYFKKISVKENLTQQNMSDINFILNQLQNFV